MNNSITKPRKKRFNITGNCYPHLHYMMDISAKMEKVDELIDYGDYFTISRPRQYGKTTLLFAIEEKLKNSEEYFPIFLNFQGLDQKADVSDGSFSFFVRNLILKNLRISYPILHEKVKEEQVNDTLELSNFITQLVHHSDKKIVLLIDEVDASSNYKPFLKFLAVLRAKYLNRFSASDYTFHSVILAGVHDVKSLKYKIKDSEDVQYNSPWNIAIDFKVPMEFNPKEIFPMISEYNEAENVGMNEEKINEISEKLYYYTSGYPFLVSRLCQIVAEDILPKRIENQEKSKEQNTKKWTLEDVEKAIILIQREVNTNFESLIKNLKNNQDLYDLIFDMLMNGKKISYDPYNSVIEKGTIYGFFRQNGQVKIHNPIYEQLIYNHLITNIENQTMQPYLTENQFILPNNELNFELILERFQVYMKENESKKEEHFLENQWRLLFLAFLRPILNGKGFDFKEVQISDERRLDVVVTYFNHKYIIELKIWRGESYHERGVLQLYDYLERQNQDTGFLVIFDNKKESKNELKTEWIEIEEKRIFAVWI
jgi:hypothetical protein